MTRFRLLSVLAAVGAVTAVTGCVAPGYYYGNQGYAQPYYADPGPVVVAPPVSVGIGVGGYWGGNGYYGRPGYYGHPGYYGRPEAYGPGPAHGPRGYEQRQGSGPRQAAPGPGAPGRPDWRTGGERVIQGPPGASGPTGP